MSGPNDTQPVVDPHAATVADATEPHRPAPSDAPVVTKVGRFRIDGSLGVGGMGEVYRAYDPVLERAVALKVLRTKHDGDQAQRRRRILREARAAAGLAHANTVTIYEVGEADGEVFIAMELLEGEVLASAFARSPPLETKLRWLLEAARALAEAHGRGLVHRDVKPDNMFVCKGGTLKLLDFGIAKRDEDEAPSSVRPATDGTPAPSSMRTTEGRTLGTPRYMAPEQRASTPTDARTDQFAWGLVAFELLTGDHALGSVETSGGEEHGPGRPAGSPCRDALLAVPGLSPEVASAIARALAVRKEDRFPSMAPVVALLEKTTSAADPAPAPDLAPAGPALSSSPRSWRGPAIAAALLAIGGGVFAVRTIEQRQRATTAAPAPSSSMAAKKAGPQCRAEPKRAYPLAQLDQMAVLPGGGLVVERFGFNPKPDHYERENAARLEPFDPLGKMELDHPSIFGTASEGKPALVFIDRMAGMSASVWREGSGFVSAQRFGRLIDGMAVASFGDAVAVIATGPDNAPAFGWVGVSVQGPDAPMRVSLIQKGEFFRYPAIATMKERMAITFAAASSLRFAYVDRAGNVAGDVLTVAPVTGPSTVGFALESPIVLWVAQVGDATRIYSATMRPDGNGFAPPVIAVEQPAALTTPLAAGLADGTFAAFWVAAASGKQTVRMAHIDAAGSLRRPIDVAGGGAIRDLRWATTATGGDVAWVDDVTHEAVVARISCVP